MTGNKPFIRFLAACAAPALAAAALGAAEMSVQVRSTPLRSAPSFLSSPVATLDYGDRVTVNEKRPPWMLCLHADGRRGWLHESALSAKRIVMHAADDAAVTASSHEVALAGKGFNQQVEHEFKGRNPNIDFTWVDRMEAMAIPAERLRDFMASPAEKGGRR